jgi:Glu-tRNA(Gln) amidotransferase subunit E-like FAD-binding protein
MEKRTPIVITNNRIIEFFSTHNNLDTDQTILSFIDIMENLSDNMNNQMNNSLVENLLKNMQSINGKIESLDNNITTFKQDYNSTFTNKMNEFKKDYMDSLRLNLTSNVSDKIEPLVKEQMNILLERTTNIINEIIPKNNNSIQDSIQKSFSEFNNEINSDTKKLLDNNITNDSLNSFKLLTPNFPKLSLQLKNG